MRLRVVCDQAGNILGAAELGDDALTVLPEPVSAEHTTMDVEVPYEQRQGDLKAICQRLRVDVEGRQLVLRE